MDREKILCVDDEEMVVDALKMELTRSLPANLIIETAGSGEEALRIVDETLSQGDHILLVISDQRMPGMTGEILLARLSELLPKALKILLTGYTDIEAIQYAINNAGLFRYIHKPWDREDLALTVMQAIEKYHTQKALEEKTNQIQKMNEELEKTVERRTMQLSESVKELEAFSYTVAHDLKSPLRTIDYYSKFILEDYSGELNDDVLSMLKNIRNVCSNVFELIEKFLQYALTSSAHLELSPVEIGSLFNQTFQELMTGDKNRRATLDIKGNLPVVLGDAILLKQVIYNILSNALKFSRQREESVIRITYSPEDKFHSFSVNDNGVGFNMAYSSKLFGIFQRMHSQNEFEGSGIGLATVKKIIEKHGGTVSISSEVDVGTTVVFTLPRSVNEQKD